MMTDNLHEMMDSITSPINQHLTNSNERDELTPGNGNCGDPMEAIDIVDNNNSESAQAKAYLPVSNVTATNANLYQPGTEEELVNYAKHLSTRIKASTTAAYWELGRCINAFYNGKYGTSELKKIAAATDIGEDSLSKACKFARQYSRDQLRILLNGSFPISWFRIAQSLSVESAKLIEVYQSSQSQEQFHNAIIKLKNPSEKRGKAKDSAVAVRNSEQPSPIIDVKTGGAVTTATEIPALADAEASFDNELDRLTTENKRLRDELLNRDDRISELEIQLRVVRDKYEDQLSEAINLKDKLNGIIEMIEQGATGLHIMGFLEANN